MTANVRKLQPDASRRRARHDPPDGPRPSLRDDPPGRDPTDSDHHLLALWAASCAEHVLYLFESVQPEDPRPRQAIEHARAWVRGEVQMMQARAAGGHAMGAARDLRGAHGMPRTLLARPGSSRTSPRTSSVRPPTRSRPHVLPRRKPRAKPQGDSSASGSATSSRRRSASSYLTTSGAERHLLVGV